MGCGLDNSSFDSVQMVRYALQDSLSEWLRSVDHTSITK